MYRPTYTSKWVDRELRKTLELRKPIMGVCMYDDGRVQYYPAALEANRALLEIFLRSFEQCGSLHPDEGTITERR